MCMYVYECVMCVCVYVCMCLYMCVVKERERERERENICASVYAWDCVCTRVCLCVCVFVCAFEWEDGSGDSPGGKMQTFSCCRPHRIEASASGFRAECGRVRACARWACVCA